MYTIYFEFNGSVGTIKITEDLLTIMEEIISRRAMILFVEDQP